MSFNVKHATAQFGFRISSINFSEDGAISASLQIGTLSESPGESAGVVFTPVATQGYYIPKDEVDAMTMQCDDPVSLRDTVCAAVEKRLRDKGQLTI